MGGTVLGIQGKLITINGKLTYSELPASLTEARGLLMNARFIQGIFDDRAAPGRFARFGRHSWDPEAHTDALIAALPEWYRYGLRAFTVGFQGGGPCFTVSNTTIDNNPFGEDGTALDPAYAARMERLIAAADSIGMAVIVSYFYGDQAARIRDGSGIRNAVVTASRFLKETGHSNILIEIANEQDIPPFKSHPIIQEEEGMAWLIDLARRESGGMPVGCSGGGGSRKRQIVDSSDIVLIHGNGQSRQQFYNMIRDVRDWAPDKPVVCNEDSQAISQMKVAALTGTSWGYYNNMTKQEPPVSWGVLPGEDTFFARRMARMVGIQLDPLPESDCYYLQGFEPEMTANGERWIRLASLYPENIDHVDFFRTSASGGECGDCARTIKEESKENSPYWTAWDDPFSVRFMSNWRQGGVAVRPGEEWTARISLRDGRILEKSAVCP